MVILGKLTLDYTCPPVEGLPDAQPEAVTVRIPMLQHSAAHTVAAQVKMEGRSVEDRLGTLWACTFHSFSRPSFFPSFLCSLYICLCICLCMQTTAHMLRSEDNLGVSPHLPPCETGFCVLPLCTPDKLAG